MVQPIKVTIQYFLQLHLLVAANQLLMAVATQVVQVVLEVVELQAEQAALETRQAPLHHKAITVETGLVLEPLRNAPVAVEVVLVLLVLMRPLVTVVRAAQEPHHL
jgi:hypothetical protein